MPLPPLAPVRLPRLHDQESVWFPVGEAGWKFVTVAEDGRVFVDGILVKPCKP